MPKFVLDASALLALVQDEPGAEIVQQLMERADSGEYSLFISVVNLGEVLYAVEGHFGMEGASEVYGGIREAPVEIVDVDQPLTLNAARLKASTGMGYLDCFAAALAQQLDAPLVTGDPDFQQLEGRVVIEWLPVST